jgi:hypothetical protein
MFQLCVLHHPVAGLDRRPFSLICMPSGGEIRFADMETPFRVPVSCHELKSSHFDGFRTAPANDPLDSLTQPHMIPESEVIS